jgi:hypothetical protein
VRGAGACDYQDDSGVKIETVDERRIWVPQRNEDLGV